MRVQNSSFPILKVQEQLIWLAEKSQGGSLAYNTLQTLSLKGNLDRTLMRQVLQEITNRHDGLRSSLDIENKRQVVHQEVKLDATLVDFSKVAETQRQVEYQNWLKKQKDIAFDLEKAPLFKFRFIKFTEQHHNLVIIAHHLVSDGWSLAVLIQEIVALYSRRYTGSYQKLEQAMQFVDYVELIEKDPKIIEQRARNQRYWLDKYRDYVPTLNLPTDFSRPKNRSFKSFCINRQIKAETVAQLRKISGQCGCTLFMVFFSAFTLILHRYSQQNDVVIGVPSSGRLAPGTESIIGYLGAVLPLLSEYRPTESLKNFIQRQKTVLLDGYEYEDFSFAELFEALPHTYAENRSALLDVVFNLQPAIRFENNSNLNVEVGFEQATHVAYDIFMDISDYQGEYELYIGFNADIFMPATGENFADSYLAVLENFLDCLDRPVKQLPLLTAAQRQTYLKVQQKSSAVIPETSLSRAIEVCVEKYPYKVALVCDESRLTFAEYNKKANQLARLMQEQGIGLESRVGVCLKRTEINYVSYLAILKLGATFVPLDAGYPKQRLQKIIQLSEIELVLVDQHNEHVITELNIQNLFLNSLDAVADYANDNLDIPIHSDALAYIIYTSGSTDEPKGVAIRNRSVLALLDAVSKIDSIELDEIWFTVNSLSFDICILENFYPLVFGGTLVIGQREWLYDPETFHKVARKENVSMCVATPSMWSLIFSQPNCVERRFKIITGGEPLSKKQAQEISQFSDHVWNFYGPTEATVWASYYRIDLQQVSQQTGSFVSIGNTLENYQFYLLDNNLELVPPGVPGVLYISGEGLAREYLNAPGLTAEKFIPNPFAATSTGENGSRLYNTGDVVKVNADGNVEYISRVDDQIKVHGFRIELSEVENAIRAYDGVTETVVIGVTDDQSAGSHKLAAYYTENNEIAIKSNDILLHLQAKLPAYMVPASIQKIEKFKLTESRKIDRSALPEPDFNALESPEKTLASSPVERALSQIWAITLKVETPDINSSFFELGGHSLMATELVNNVNNSAYFTEALRLMDVFTYPSIALMAKHLQTALSKAAQSLFTTASEGSVRALDISESKNTASPNPLDYQIETNADTRFEPFPLTDLQQAYWIGLSSAVMLGNAESYNYYALEVSVKHAALVELAWNRLIARHDMLRMVTTEDGRQQILPDIEHYTVALEDLRILSQEMRQRRLAEISREMTFANQQQAQSEHYRLRLSRLSEQQYCLHITLSMMVFDGASLCMILDELATLLDAPEHQFETLSLNFRDCVLAASKIKTTESYQLAKQFWQSRINSIPAAPKLPLAKDIYTVERPYLSRASFGLEKASWERIKTKASKHSVTPSILAFTVFSELLCFWSNSRHFTINLTLFNRLGQHPQLNQVIGDFTSTTLLEVNRKEEYTFIEAAQANQVQLLTDLQHRHYGGVQVLRDINLAQGDGTQVLMPIVFTSDLSIDFQSNKPATAPALKELCPGLSLTPQVLMDFMVMEEMGEFVVTLDYLAEVFPENLIENLISEYERVIRALGESDELWYAKALVQCPQQQLTKRSALNIDTQYSKEALLHSGFEQQVQLRPEAIAVINPDESHFTYQQINDMAGYLADQLIEDHVNENDLVAVLLDKGWEQTVATLAVLKSGAAYLPLNTDAPPKSLASILAQSGTRRLITKEQWSKLPELKAETDHTFIIDDRIRDKVGSQQSYARQKSSSLAYVIYTSGSTGKPKGVMLDHTGPVNTNDSINRLFNIGASDRVLALSALSFDLSVYDIFGILSVGGVIVYPDAAKERDPAHWFQLVETRQVSLWNSVPALMQIFTDFLFAENKKLPSSLRTVMMSGDWIPVRLPDQLRGLRVGDNTDTLNIYSLGGATEASIWSIYYPIERVNPDWKSIPYGKPLFNQQYYVLDQSLQPLPDYVVGDLYIGGVGLAQGYFNDKIKTNASFFVHPDLNVRLYRTGDTGCYLADGNIEFCGRKDTQVKVQGYRVELGQIEHNINEHPQVKESVVLAEGGLSENKRLVAYIVRQSTKDALAAVATIEQDTLPLKSRPESSQVNDQNINPENAKLATENALLKLSRKGLRRDLDLCNEIAFQSKVREPGILQLNCENPLLAFNPNKDANTNEEGSSTGNRVGSESLFELLACLCETQVESLPLPKYFYPSAGSLNPVQTYISVPYALSNESGKEEVPPGIYYLNSQTWSLTLVAIREQSGIVNQVEDASIHIYLLGKNDAISPLYENHSEMLCMVEAGYMESLLEGVASSQDLHLTRNDISMSQEAALLSSLQMSEEDWLLSDLTLCSSYRRAPQVDSAGHFSLGIFERQSYRQFSNEGLSFANVENLLLKLGWSLPQSAETIEPSEKIASAFADIGLYVYFKRPQNGAHYYQFEPRQQKLLALDLEEDQNLGHHTRGNSTVEAQSDFSIFVAGNLESPTVHEQFHLCGQIGQRLSCIAPKLHIGICPIGWIDDRDLKTLLPLPSGYSILHSFIGGTISLSQTLRWGEEANESAPDEKVQQIKANDLTLDGEQLTQQVKIVLENTLAPYMVPQSYRIIDNLPLTANGKVDRKRLPEQAFEEYKVKAFVAPTDEWQKRIAALWCDTLELEKVGIDEHFFALGGDSVSLIGMASIFRKQLNIDINIIDLFNYPTVGSLAEFIGNQEQVKSKADESFNKTQEKAAKQRHRAAAIRGNRRSVKREVS